MRVIKTLAIVMALVLTACGSSSSPQSIPNLSVPIELKKFKSNSDLTAQEQGYIGEVLAILENYSTGIEDGGALLMEAGKENSLVFDQDWKDKMVIALALIKANSTLARDLTPPAQFEAAHQNLLALATQMEEIATLVAEGTKDLDTDKFDQASAKIDTAQQTMDTLSTAIVPAAGTGAQPSSASTAKAKQNANLRSGPGKDYALAGSVTAGQALKIVAKNKAGDWYQLADDKWIAAFLVNGVPTELPVVGATTVAPAKAAVATARPAAKASGATANKNANLRKGPGTNYAVGGSTKAGQALEIVGKNETGDWYQLASGLWIANFLVNNAPDGMPIIEASTPPPTVAPPKEQYLPLLAHLFMDVKIYYGKGSTKTYGFQAMGGSENCSSMPSGRGVLVSYPDGKTEWKDRINLVGSGLYFVKSNDPNADSFQWVDLPGCP